MLKGIDPKVKSTFVALCEPEEALVHQARALLQQMRKVTLNHVKDHQDDSVPYEQLSLPARLNIDCDALAKKQMQETGVVDGRPLPPEGTGIAFYLGNDLVTTNLKSKIQLALYGNGMINYLQKSNSGLSNTPTASISRQSALQKTPLKRRIHYVGHLK